MKFRYLLEADTEELYPQFDKLTNKSLSEAYDYFNKKLFGSKLPEVRIKFNALAKNFYGKAHCKYDAGTYKIDDLLITISKKIQTNHKLALDSLLHEMIHIKQYSMNEKYKTFKYTEATWDEIMSSNDKHTYGHNKYFIDMMNKFNAMGYDIDIESDSPIGTELENYVYGICFNNNSNTSVLLWSPYDISKNEEKIVDSVLDKKGTLFDNYTIFKTKESNITLSTRLTKTFNLPKNVVNIEFKSSWVDSILNSTSTSIILNSNIDTEGNVSNDNSNAQNEIIDMLSRTAKYRNVGFSSFFQTVWSNAFPEWRSIKGTELYSKGKMFKEQKVPNDLTLESAQAIYDNWMNISKAELKRAKTFSYFGSSYLYDIIMKKDITRTLEKLQNDYEDDFKMRVSLDDFREAAYAGALKEMKKKSKKYDDSTFREMFNENIKNTWLA